MLFRILIIVIAIWILLRLIASYKEKQLDSIGFITWTFIWIGIIVAILHPVWSEQLSRIIGIGKGTDIAFFIAIFLLFYLVFRVYVKITAVESDVTELAKHIALINRQLDNGFGQKLLKNKKDKDGEKEKPN